MVGCNQTRRLIDESDQPELLPLEVSRHVALCPDCESFAEGRARLRSLLASGARVTVPMNFDAVLKARLTEVKARTAFSWLSPAGYLRLGGATAALAAMVFTAQYAGLFRGPTGALTAEVEKTRPTLITPTQPPPNRPAIITNGAAPGATTTVRNYSVAPIQTANRYPVRTAGGRIPLEVPREDYLHEDGGVMLVRGSNGEDEVSLPMVSVGAQSLVYASAGAGRRTTTRTIGTSF